MSYILVTWRLLILEAALFGVLSLLAFRLEQYTLTRITAPQVRGWDPGRIDALSAATEAFRRVARALAPISALAIAALILIAILRPEDRIYNLALAFAAGYVYLSVRHFAQFVEKMRNQVLYLAPHTD